MGLESGTSISILDASWPLVSDKRSEGDDHLRLIKAVLKATFPGAGGQGFSVPITAKESDLNSIFTTGARTVFYMASPPTGWVASNPGTNYTLVSAGAGGTVGGGGGIGANIVTGCTTVPDHSHAQQGSFVTGISNQSLAHSHTLGTRIASNTSFFSAQGGGGVFDAIRASTILDPSNTSGTTIDITTHNHTVSLSGQTSNVNVVAGGTNSVGVWQPTYALVVIATKS